MSGVALYDSGQEPSRIREPVLLAIFSALIVVISLLVVVLVRLGAPDTAAGACPVGSACDPPSGAPTGLSGSWVSELGFRVEYLPSVWSVTLEEPRHLRLAFEDGEWISIRGTRDRNAAKLFADELDRIRRTPGVRSVEAANATERKILGAGLGGRAGVGGIFCAHIGAQVVNSYVELFVIAATDGRSSAVTTLYTNDCDKLLRQSEVLSAADSILNTFAWDGEGM